MQRVNLVIARFTARNVCRLDIHSVVTSRRENRAGDGLSELEAHRVRCAPISLVKIRGQGSVQLGLLMRIERHQGVMGCGRGGCTDIDSFRRSRGELKRRVSSFHSVHGVVDRRVDDCERERSSRGTSLVRHISHVVDLVRLQGNRIPIQDDISGQQAACFQSFELRPAFASRMSRLCRGMTRIVESTTYCWEHRTHSRLRMISAIACGA